MLAAKLAYEHSANTYGEAILAVKLDTHGDQVYEHYTNACGEATLASKLNTHGEVAYEYLLAHATKLCSGELVVKY